MRGAAAGRPAVRRLEVELAERSYAVHVGVGTLGGAGREVARRTGADLAVVVSVPAVARRYAGVLERSLRRAGLRTARLLVPDGDRTKRLDVVARLYDRLLDVGADRHSALVALGGGMVGDLTGFTAATFLRGIPFVQVPTTLLAMIDASVGGKVGVNLRRGKNLVGAFHQPRLVWVDAATLETLPARERAAGFAEMVKAAALWDAAFFATLERDAEALVAGDAARLVPALERAIAIKAEIVARDERESGLRMLLNLGHTLAHAVERLTGYRRVLHGEAVAMGLVYAARRSEALRYAPSGTAARMEALLRRFALPTELPPFPRGAYLDALRVDKKSRSGRIRYVVLRGIGRARTVPLTAAQILPAGAIGGARRGRARGKRT